MSSSDTEIKLLLTNIMKKEFIMKMNSGQEEYMDEVIAIYHNPLKYHFIKEMSLSNAMYYINCVHSYENYLKSILNDETLIATSYVEKLYNKFRELSKFMNERLDGKQ